MNIRPMTDVEKRSAAKTFVETWLGRGDEKQDAQNFWRMLLHLIVEALEMTDDETNFFFDRKENDTVMLSPYSDDYKEVSDQNDPCVEPVCQP